MLAAMTVSPLAGFSGLVIQLHCQWSTRRMIYLLHFYRTFFLTNAFAPVPSPEHDQQTPFSVVQFSYKLASLLPEFVSKLLFSTLRNVHI